MLFQQVCERHLVEWQAHGFVWEPVVDARVQRVPTRHETCSRWGARRLHIVIVEEDATLRQAVEGRGERNARVGGLAIAQSNVVESEIICRADSSAGVTDTQDLSTWHDAALWCCCTFACMPCLPAGRIQRAGGHGPATTNNMCGNALAAASTSCARHESSTRMCKIRIIALLDASGALHCTGAQLWYLCRSQTAP